MDIAIDPRLREIHLGEWQGLTRAEARARFPEEYARWQSRRGRAARRRRDVRRGWRAGRRVRARVAGPSSARARCCVAVTHGGTARATIGTLLGMAPDTWWRLAPLSNCRWSLLADMGRGWRLEEHNAGSPPEEETGDDAR